MLLHEEFDPGPLAALYRPLEVGAWRLRVWDGGQIPMRGYWSPVKSVTRLVTLERNEETWMSLSPVEYESEAIGIAAARGHVAIFGLGMGWAAAECAMREEVDMVTVVECDRDVIALHRELDLFARLPGDVGDKVAIVEGDAFSWRPAAPVDLLMPDIWLRLVDEADRVAEVRRMQDNVAAAEVYFWGQELEIARRAVADGRALDDAGIAATIAGFGLPLVGPSTPDYAARVRAAASTRMHDRWLPGSEAPRDLAPFGA